MELAVITAKQVAELLLMILAGAVCCKAGVFKPKEKSVLANLLLYLVVPPWCWTAIWSSTIPPPSTT